MIDRKIVTGERKTSDYSRLAAGQHAIYGRTIMIYLTGDTHGDFRRFSTRVFPEQKQMTKDDYVIILGDFAGIWSTDPEDSTEKYWLNRRLHCT